VLDDGRFAQARIQSLPPAGTPRSIKDADPQLAGLEDPRRRQGCAGNEPLPLTKEVVGRGGAGWKWPDRPTAPRFPFYEGGHVK